MRIIKEAVVLFFSGILFFSACSSSSGPGGEDTGNSGSSSIFVKKTAIAPGDTCTSGGVQLDMGFDVNSNKVLDPGEITSTEYVCNGDDGMNGLVITSTIEPGDTCSSGGVEILTGIDSNGNDVLDESEITGSRSVCNGQDGEDVTSLNVSGVIASGNCLALVHNLGRDDLTFTGQFLKGGYIYDYTDYYYQFYGLYMMSDPVVYTSAPNEYITVAKLPHNCYLIAYPDASNGLYGTFRIFNSAGTCIVGPKVFAAERISSVAAKPLKSGKVLINYTTERDISSYVICDGSGNCTRIFGSIPRQSERTNCISVTESAEGNIIFAYSAGTQTAFNIFDSSGTLVKGPILISSNRTDFIAVTSLLNSNIMIAYPDRLNSNYGTLVIYDAAGNLVSGPVVFENAGISYVSAATENDGNVIIAYSDAGNSNSGTVVIYDSAGKLVSGPSVIEAGRSDYIYTTALDNGNFLVTYQNYTDTYSGRYVLFDSSGRPLSWPASFVSGRANYITASELENGSVLVSSFSGSGTMATLRKGLLKLQKVSSNEVRLWNYTGNPLRMMLSVNQ